MIKTQINWKVFLNLIQHTVDLNNIKKCLDGEKYQKESDKDISKSINHEMYLQKIKKNNIIYFRL